jgi:hypothetical protein
MKDRGVSWFLTISPENHFLGSSFTSTCSPTLNGGYSFVCLSAYCFCRWRFLVSCAATSFGRLVASTLATVIGVRICCPNALSLDYGRFSVGVTRSISNTNLIYRFRLCYISSTCSWWFVYTKRSANPFD